MSHHTIIVHYTPDGRRNELAFSGTEYECNIKSEQLNVVFAPNGNTPDDDYYSIATVVTEKIKNTMKF